MAITSLAAQIVSWAIVSYAALMLTVLVGAVIIGIIAQIIGFFTEDDL